MKIRFALSLLLLTILCFSCRNDDDDDGIVSVPPRDRGEQAATDDARIRMFLETYFYNYEEFENPPAGFDFQIRFEKIEGDNSDKIPMIDQVTSKTINRFDTDQTLYILTAREGQTVGTEGETLHVPTIADSVFIKYRGSNLGRFADGDEDGIKDYADADADENSSAQDSDGDGIIDAEDADNDNDQVTDDGVQDENGDGVIDRQVTIFDSAPQPTWFDLTQGIEGFTNGIAGSKSTSGFSISSDGTPSFDNNFEIGAIFIPSGLAYFNAPPNSNIPLYSPLIFTFDHFFSIETDHDQDGIISIDEDINNNGFLFDDDEDADNTDGDLAFNFRDSDDDNDNVITRLEVNFVVRIVDGEEVEVFDSYKDTDGDGTPDHLDTDDDGDGRPTASELRTNSNTGAIIYFDSDGDGIPDYLDADS
ncbi:hypothetical protein EAX61_07235 [Dokdonia sinensis]|uniref:Peptidylprolyl isomerase n=2 Tax=Dokdonia sinensis TaxID=2479847 RepID=A0A3M0G6T0_9FLAO|nr:hypothetical protein EAX61_07235 [Dokdonia sinensis]